MVVVIWVVMIRVGIQLRIRLKKDIVDNTTGLEIINQVRVRNFKYKQYSDGSPVSSDDTVDISEFSDHDNINQVLIQQGVTGVQLSCIIN